MAVQVAGESVTRDGGAVVAWRALAEKQTPFTQVLVGDLEPERARALPDPLIQAEALIEIRESCVQRTSHVMAKFNVCKCARTRRWTFAMRDLGVAPNMVSCSLAVRQFVADHVLRERKGG
jgi:hypothetical protein